MTEPPDTSDVFGRALERAIANRHALSAPFAGIGLFTAWNATAALQGVGFVDSVAIRPDLCPVDVWGELEPHFNMFAWEDLAGARTWLYGIEGHAGYIAQSETEAQRQAAAAVVASPLAPEGEGRNMLLDIPRGLVGGLWLDGWTPLLECYGVSVPADLGPGYPVLGVFDGTPLSDYLPSLGTRRDFWIYLAEGMQPGDWDTLARLRA